MTSASSPCFLLVANTPGDVRRFWLPLLRQARAAGFRVVCAVPGGPEAAAEAGLDGSNAGLAALRDFPLDRRGMNPLKDMLTCAALGSLLCRERPALVLAASIKCVIYGGLAWRFAAWMTRRCGSAEKLPGPAALRAGLPHTVPPRFFAAVTGLGHAFMTEGLRGRLLRRLACRLYRWALAGAHGVFFQNDEDVDVFRAAGILRGMMSGMPPAAGPVPVRPVLPRTVPAAWITAGVGVDTERFSFSPLPPLPPRGPVVFLLAARLLLAKGIAEFAEAARLLRMRWPVEAARFCLLGPREQGAGAVTPQMLRDWTACGPLEYWGAAADVRPLFRAAHVLVLPSWREGRPTVVMEGFALGRPAVVSDAPGCRESVRHGVDGLVVPVRHAGALAAALEELLRAPQRIVRMGSAARCAAETCCDARKVAAGMMDAMLWGREA